MTPSIPNLGGGSSSGNRLREGSGNTLRRVYFQVELGKINLGTTAVVLQAISGMAIPKVTYGRFLPKWLRPCRTHQVEAPRGGSLPLSVPLLLPPCFPPSLSPSVLGPACSVCCVELSELTSGIPIGVKLSYVSCASPVCQLTTMYVSELHAEDRGQMCRLHTGGPTHDGWNPPP